MKGENDVPISHKEFDKASELQITLDSLILALVNRMHRVLEEGASLDQLTPLAQTLVAVNPAWHHLNQGDAMATVMQAVLSALQSVVQQRSSPEAPTMPYVPPLSSWKVYRNKKTGELVRVTPDYPFGPEPLQHVEMPNEHGQYYMPGARMREFRNLESLLQDYELAEDTATDTDQDSPGRVP